MIVIGALACDHADAIVQAREEGMDLEAEYLQDAPAEFVDGEVYNGSVFAVEYEHHPDGSGSISWDCPVCAEHHYEERR